METKNNKKLINGDAMSKQKGYFEIDEIENLIDNIKMVAHFLDEDIPYTWKWVIIAVHQALYRALIITLQGSDSRQTVVDREKKSGEAVMLHVDGMPIDLIASNR